MRIGPSLKRGLIRDYQNILPGLRICEFLVETWDPNNAEDIQILKGIQKDTELLPHCITLNLLADGPSARSIDIVREWIKILNLKWISDHFCWSSFQGRASGLAIPPLVPIEKCIEKLNRIQELFQVELVLENIPTPYDDATRVFGYHSLLVETINRTGFGLLLDVENIRIDADNARINGNEILKLYDGIKPKYLHLAGGGHNGVMEGDSHDRICSEATLELLRAVPRFDSSDVIYERDYALDTTEVAQEIDRLVRLFGQRQNNSTTK